MALQAKRPTPRQETAEKIKRDLAGKGEPAIKRLNVNVTEDELRAMKGRALEEGRTVSDITRELWKEYLSK